MTASIELLERAEELNVLAEKTYDEALERARRVDDGDEPAGALLGVPRSSRISKISSWSSDQEGLPRAARRASRR